MIWLTIYPIACVIATAFACALLHAGKVQALQDQRDRIGERDEGFGGHIHGELTSHNQGAE